MFDYTPDGINYIRNNEANDLLYAINARLKKINRNLALLTFIGISSFLIAHQNYIKKELKKMKGE